MLNIELRHPEDVMKLSRLGSFHQSKLSFLRSFIREFKFSDISGNLFLLNGIAHNIYVVVGYKESNPTRM